jgi:hypothetical protein
MSRANATASTISWSKVSTDNFDITKPEENDRSPAQKISYIRYKYKSSAGQLYMKTPRILMSSGGIPQKNEKFYQNEMKRAKGFKIPFNKKSSDEEDFYNKMKELDAYFSSKEFRRDVLGFSEKTLDSYDYVSIVRKPQEEDDDDDDDGDEEKMRIRKMRKEKREKDGPRPEYMKPFFELEYETDKVLVKVLLKEGEDKSTIVDDKLYNEAKDDNGDPLSALDVIARSYVNWNSTAKFIMTPNKLYVAKQKDPKTNKKNYGVSWKIICVETEPAEQKGGKQKLPDDPFKSDDEDDIDVKSTVFKITKMNLKEVEEVEQIDYGTVQEDEDGGEEAAEEEEDAAEAEEEEEEEVVEVKPKAKTKAKVEEEVKPASKKTKKNSSV